MRNKKRITTFLLALIMLMTMPIWTANAEAASGPSVFVNGVKVKYAQAPVVRDGATLVSAKETIESLGLSFTWDASNKRIIGSNGETTVTFVVGQLSATINGVTVFLNTAPAQVNGRTMVPLKPLLDTMGAVATTKPDLISIKTGDPKKTKFYTGLPLQITNSSIKNLGGNAVTVDYVQYSMYDGEIYTMDYTMTIAPGQKGGFENATNVPGFSIDVNGEDHTFLGRAIHSMSKQGEDTASRSYQYTDQTYLSDSFYTSLTNMWGKVLADYKKQLKQELVNNKNVPLQIQASNISYDTMGYPEANIRLKNLTEKKIVAFELSFSCFDAYGDPVKGGYPYTNRFYGKASDVVDWGDTYTFTWDLWSYSDTSKISNITIDKVAFSDGSVWKRKK
ncbi:copper amine oxidase domain protein [Paenibacillus curdlanolyticus YK9]|uniref:Copper amine oxidase domain protein n=1 Tax=Paenibacillus curdlanolyticus YK9 TaxID=717606 RepID=E0I936_9BACL|nr:stalk domain-containing protein [Paenibacillus curdlanolyticus]EFM10920.1 copper amine oxidase domain protein [Paenibacillus curdlanolyticus YK9]